MAKLNDLQDTVFTQYPQALREYSQVVSAYYDQVSGLGFSSLVHSLQDDADAVARTLEGEQLDAITTITGELKTAFQEAADAMGTSPESVAGIDSLAETSLLEAGRRRKDVGRQLQEAYEEFTKGLVEKTAHLQALATAISNVSYVTSIPSSVIFRAIKNGNLSAGEVSPYLDAVTSKTDAQALEAIISYNPGNVMKVDPNAISDSMYSVIAEEINQWTAQGAIEKLNYLAGAMSVNDLDKNDIFTNRLLVVEDVKAAALMDKMHELSQNKPVYPEGGSAKEIAEYQALLALYEIEMEGYERQLATLNTGTGFVNSLQFLRVGTTSSEVYRAKVNGTDDIIIHDYTQISAMISVGPNGGFTFEVHRNHLNSIYGTPTIQMWNKVGQKSSEVYVSSLGESRLSSLGGEVDQRLFELKQERIEAKKELTSNTIESIVKGTISLHPYGAFAVTGVEALSALSGTDKADAASKGKAFADSSYEKVKELYKNKTGQDLEPETIQKYSQVTSKGLDVAIEILGHHQQFEQLMGELDKKGDEATQDFLKLLFDQGGWSISTDTDDPFGQLDSQGRDGNVYPSKSVTSTSTFYDFNAYQRLREFDAHGLTKFAEDQLGRDAKLDDKLTTDDPELRAYLLGQETYLDSKTQTERPVDLSLATMSADQVVEFIEVAKKVGDNSLDPLNKYMETHYGDNR